MRTGFETDYRRNLGQIGVVESEEVSDFVPHSVLYFTRQLCAGGTQGQDRTTVDRNSIWCAEVLSRSPLDQRRSLIKPKQGLGMAALAAPTATLWRPLHHRNHDVLESVPELYRKLGQGSRHEPLKLLTVRSIPMLDRPQRFEPLTS